MKKCKRCESKKLPVKSLYIKKLVCPDYGYLYEGGDI